MHTFAATAELRCKLTILGHKSLSCCLIVMVVDVVSVKPLHFMHAIFIFSTNILPDIQCHTGGVLAAVPSAAI